MWIAHCPHLTIMTTLCAPKSHPVITNIINTLDVIKLIKPVFLIVSHSTATYQTKSWGSFLSIFDLP